MNKIMHVCGIADWILVLETVSRCVSAVRALLWLEDLFNRRWKPRPV